MSDEHNWYPPMDWRGSGELEHCERCEMNRHRHTPTSGWAWQRKRGARWVYEDVKPIPECKSVWS